MPVQAPITRETHLVLRALALDFTETERRRRHPPVLWAGHPDQAACRLDLADVGALDAGLRTDMVAGLVVQARFGARRLGGDEARVPWLWLTRSGRVADEDRDAEWAAAALAACGELAMPCPFVVVVRHGWYDPVSGVRREWVRLRRRS